MSRHAEGALGGAAQVGREAAIALQQGVVDQRLQEDGAAAGAQHAGDFRDGDLQVQVVEDLLAQHRVEGAIGERAASRPRTATGRPGRRPVRRPRGAAPPAAG